MRRFNMENFFNYIDSDGAFQNVKGLSIRKDKAGKYWLWSDQLNKNIAIKANNLEDMLKMALNSVLFTVHIKQTRLDTLTELKNKVDAFVEAISVNDES
jgi:ABC-type uncharacterized transport system involved in gliding motility auxiliary subunit